MLAQGFLRVKGQAKITKCYFLWVCAINMQSLSGHYLMHQQVPMVFLLLLVYLGTVAYISVEISLGSFWRRGILRVKGQALFTNCNFLLLCVHGVICNCWVATIWCAIKYPWCLYFFSLSKCCCLHLCRKKFGLLLVWGYFKGQRSRIITNCNILWLCVICNHRVVTTRCAIKYPWCFLLLLIYLSAVTCISEKKKFGSMLAQGYFNC